MAITIVRVINKSNVDFMDKYNSQEFSIPAGMESLVPYEAMCLWVGDPQSVDTERNPARRAEFHRLRVRYGSYDDTEMWRENKPDLEFADAEGNRIVTVADDPEGSPSDIPSKSVTADYLHKQLQMVQDQLKQFSSVLTPDQLSFLAAHQASNPPPVDQDTGGTDASVPPSDRPSRVKLPRRQ